MYAQKKWPACKWLGSDVKLGPLLQSRLATLRQTKCKPSATKRNKASACLTAAILFYTLIEHFFGVFKQILSLPNSYHIT